MVYLLDPMGQFSCQRAGICLRTSEFRPAESLPLAVDTSERRPIGTSESEDPIYPRFQQPETC